MGDTKFITAEQHAANRRAAKARRGKHKSSTFGGSNVIELAKRERRQPVVLDKHRAQARVWNNTLQRIYDISEKYGWHALEEEAAQQMLRELVYGENNTVVVEHLLEQSKQPQLIRATLQNQFVTTIIKQSKFFAEGVELPGTKESWFEKRRASVTAKLQKPASAPASA